MPLHLDYRPQNLNEFLGNEETKAALKLVIEDVPERRPRTLLFSGMTGCGKTTLARIVAQEVGCSSDFDFQELNDVQGTTSRRIDNGRGGGVVSHSHILVNLHVMSVLDGNGIALTWLHPACVRYFLLICLRPHGKVSYRGGFFVRSKDYAYIED